MNEITLDKRKFKYLKKVSKIVSPFLWKFFDDEKTFQLLFVSQIIEDNSGEEKAN